MEKVNMLFLQPEIYTDYIHTNMLSQDIIHYNISNINGKTC